MARILHLSDLHLQTRERAETTLGQLDSDLRREMRIDALDAIVVSGDNTESAQPDEYDAAASFVTQLCEMMKVARDNVLVVPGNHDVDWMASRMSYSVVRASEAPASSISRYQNPSNRDYIEVVSDAGRYQRRFDNYARYHHQVTGRNYPLEYAEQFEIVTSADNSVVLLGLNSAWNLDHYCPDRSSIEARALNRGLLAAKKRVQEMGSGARIVASWHHPAHGDGSLRDTSFFQRLIVDDVVAILHGHVHKPITEQYNYEWTAHGRRLFLLGAGTFDSPSVHRGYPWHYCLIFVEGNELRVQSRGKSERDGAWHPNARYLLARDKPPADVLRLELVTSAAHPSADGESTSGSFVGHARPLRTVSALKARLGDRQFDAMGYRIAVEALIFDPNGRLLLQERGPDCRDEIGKLECIGGQVFGEDLIESLVRHVHERVGAGVRVEVDELLDEQPTRHVERHGPEDWLVVSYLCRLIEGEPDPVDRGKTAALRWVELSELHTIPDDHLSRSTSRARDVYRVKFRTNPYFSLAGRLA